MKKRIRVGILFGGRSGEHEVSLVSAASVIKALDPAKYEVVPIGISIEGRWHMGSGARTPLAEVLKKGQVVIPSVDPSGPKFFNRDRQGGPRRVRAVDVIFPVLHGTFGEDGTVQGLLDLAGLPYVGAGVLVCLPPECTEQQLESALRGAKAAVAGTAGSRFVLVQHDLRHSRGAAGLAKTLSGNTKYTVFAPTDAAFASAKHVVSLKVRNNRITANFNRAIDAVSGPGGTIICRSTLTNPDDGCQPLNLFGENQFTQSAKDYTFGTARQDATSSLSSKATQSRDDR